MKRWDKKDEQWLIDNYQFYSIDECCKILNKTNPSIHVKVSRLKITKKHEWSIEEINWLKENYPKFGIEFCANHLKVSKRVIEYKIKKKNLGLKFDYIYEEKSGFKTCFHCKEKKELNCFSKNKNRYFGINDTCKKCTQVYATEWTKKERLNNITFRVATNCRKRVWSALKGKHYKMDHTFNLIGCTPNFFKEYLESKFIPGMRWENYGKKGWTIDHIIPCDSFDLTKEEEQRKCFNYKNCCPIWHTSTIAKNYGYDNYIGNVEKGNKILKEF